MARVRRTPMALSAAGIFAGAAVLNAVQWLLPGGPPLSLVPAAGAGLAALAIALAGPRLPRTALYALGLVGVALIGVAIGTTRDYGDAAVLYVWPTVWVAYFFGTRHTVAAVAWIAIVHALALLALPPEMTSVDRWIDVVAAAAVVALVVRTLAARNARLIARFAEEAREDALTKVLNRRGFDERLAIERDRLERTGGSLAALALDVDEFKAINDGYGHETGDRVLAWIGSILRESVRSIDLVARTGGDEFVVVLPGADAAAAERTADALRTRTTPDAGPCPRARHGVPADLPVRLSVGVAACEDAIGALDLLDRADRALYDAKEGGRDRVALARA